jgi:hypothetical protein
VYVLQFRWEEALKEGEAQRCAGVTRAFGDFEAAMGNGLNEVRGWY